MKACSPVWSALCLALGLVSPNRVYGEAGCFVVEIVMDQPAALREPVDPQELRRKKIRLRVCIREEK